MEPLSPFGDRRHQNRSALLVPVGALEADVAQIGRERDLMGANLRLASCAGLERPNGERMSQAVNARPWRSRRDSVEADGTEQPDEGASDAGIQESPTLTRKEDSLTQHPPARGEIDLKLTTRAWVQGNQAALPEFRLKNQKTIACDVLRPNAKRLGNAEAGGCKQSKECGEHQRPKAALTLDAGRRSDQSRDLVPTEDERQWASEVTTTEDAGGGEFVALVLRAEVAREEDDLPETEVSLGESCCLCCPLDRGRNLDVSVAMPAREQRKTPKRAARGTQVEA